MVLDHLDNVNTYVGLGSGLAIALKYLQQSDLAALAPGHHAVDADRVFALVSEYDTRAVEDSRWEAHRRHIDVQAVVAGDERVGYAELRTLTAGPYDVEKDVLFAEGEGAFATLAPGRFAIFFPHDAHMPGVVVGAPGPVKKIVMKVRIADR